jgi:tRNA threonylcarbamoyladenosine biosynthesis protein TsaB
MTLLGLDTSTAAAAACVLRDDGEVFEVVPDPAALGRSPAHARELLPAVARVMEAAGVDWADLEAIALGVGPGSFTGLRIGVATARSLAAANRLALRPASSLAALAAGIEAESGAAPVLPLIDAKRGELFAALYGRGRGPDIGERPALVELWTPVAARPEELAERVRNAGLSPLSAGDGSLRFRGVLERAGIEVAPEDSITHVVRALQVCRLAAGAPDEHPEAVLPHYLRAPDAKPQ